MTNLPPNLTEVVEPLREADEYARLQLIRQKGLYNIVTGLPMAFFVLPTVVQVLLFALFPRNPGQAAEAWKVFVPLFFWVPFVLSCFPGWFIPLVRRHRPDWQSPLIQANLLKKALEKQFWFQFPFWMAYVFLAPIVLMVLTFTVDPVRGLVFWFAVGGFCLHVAAALALAWQARRTKDRALSWSFLGFAPIGALALIQPDQAPSLVGMVLLAVVLVVPPIIVGLVRMLAPRRWLLA